MLEPRYPAVKVPPAVASNIVTTGDWPGVRPKENGSARSTDSKREINRPHSPAPK